MRLLFSSLVYMVCAVHAAGAMNHLHTEYDHLKQTFYNYKVSFDNPQAVDTSLESNPSPLRDSFADLLLQDIPSQSLEFILIAHHLYEQLVEQSKVDELLFNTYKKASEANFDFAALYYQQGRYRVALLCMQNACRKAEEAFIHLKEKKKNENIVNQVNPYIQDIMVTVAVEAKKSNQG